MAEYDFTLIVDGDVTDERLDALFEAGLDDGTVSHLRGGAEIDVSRAAPSLIDALLGAIREVESVEGLSVGRVEPDELVYAAEIAERVGRSRSSVDFLIRGERGPGNFPRPVTHHASRNPLWRWAEVAAWFAIYDRKPLDEVVRERVAAVGAVNGILEARRYADMLLVDELAQVVMLIELDARSLESVGGRGARKSKRSRTTRRRAAPKSSSKEKAASGRTLNRRRRTKKAKPSKRKPRKKASSRGAKSRS